MHSAQSNVQSNARRQSTRKRVTNHAAPQAAADPPSANLAGSGSVVGATPIRSTANGGDPDQLVTLTTARTEFEGNIVRAVLADANITAHVFATAAMGVQWEGGYTDPIKIQVRRGELAKAARVLKQRRQDSVDLDWADVDVGQMEPGAPPAPYQAGTYWQRRARRARVARMGFLLLGASMLIAFIGAQSVIPTAIFTGVAMAAYWNGDPSR